MVTKYVIYNPTYNGYLVSVKDTVHDKHEIVWKSQISFAAHFSYSEALKLREELHLDNCILRGVK